MARYSETLTDHLMAEFRVELVPGTEFRGFRGHQRVPEFRGHGVPGTPCVMLERKFRGHQKFR